METGNKAADISSAAQSLCGTEFRLHGRDCEYGLDCIGLAGACLSAADIDCDLPTGYSIRGGNADQIHKFMQAAGFVAILDGENLQDGDVVLASPSPMQWHFMIRANHGFVHAHAGIGKVVFASGASPWPIKAIFRILEA